MMKAESLAEGQQDALEVIAWIASQPWCTGNVGMMGISWGGFNSLQVAAHRPPALKAIITVCSTDDRYTDDCHYMGGCVLGSDLLNWASIMFAYNGLPPDQAVQLSPESLPPPMEAPVPRLVSLALSRNPVVAQAEQERARWQQETERLAGERRLLNERKAMLEQRVAEAGERLAQLGREETELAGKLAEQNDEWAVARRYMSAESITKALAEPIDEPEEVIAIAAAA